MGNETWEGNNLAAYVSIAIIYSLPKCHLMNTIHDHNIEDYIENKLKSGVDDTLASYLLDYSLGYTHTCIIPKCTW